MIWIIIYFGVNLFGAGCYLGDNYKWSQTQHEKTLCILGSVLILVVGLPWLILAIIWGFCVKWFNELNMIFQLTFWIPFFFTKRYNNLKKSKLEALNKAAMQKSQITLKGKIFKYCVGLINTRNNYTYVESSEHLF